MDTVYNFEHTQGIYPYVLFWTIFYPTEKIINAAMLLSRICLFVFPIHLTRSRLFSSLSFVRIYHCLSLFFLDYFLSYIILTVIFP